MRDLAKLLFDLANFGGRSIRSPEMRPWHPRGAKTGGPGGPPLCSRVVIDLFGRLHARLLRLVTKVLAVKPDNQPDHGELRCQSDCSECPVTGTELVDQPSIDRVPSTSATAPMTTEVTRKSPTT